MAAGIGVGRTSRDLCAASGVRCDIGGEHKIKYISGVSLALLLGPSASPRVAHQIQSAKQRSDFSGEAAACSALAKQEPHEFEVHFLARNGRHPGAR